MRCKYVFEIYVLYIYICIIYIIRVIYMCYIYIIYICVYIYVYVYVYNLNGIQWSWFQIPLKPTFYSYFKESFSGEIYNTYLKYIYYINT